jgi:putative ABC transport system substrate-binding protein
MILRREFITLIGGAAAAWPLPARAQQPAVPVVGFFSGRSPDDSARYGAAFRKGLSTSGAIEGQGLTVEYHWLDGQYDQQPALLADLVRRRVPVIAAVGAPTALAAKAATASVPIVFAVADDSVRLGLVASLARPGANATGINFLAVEVLAKRLNLLRELLPEATRIAVLVNPTNGTNADSTLRDVSEEFKPLRPAPSPRWVPPSPPWCAIRPTRSSSAPTGSWLAGACRSRSRLRAMGYRPLPPIARTSRPGH